VSAAQVDAIKQAGYRHDVLVFRRQRLTDDDLLAFSRHFGELDPPPNQGGGRKSPPGYPDIHVVSNVRDERGEPIGAHRRDAFDPAARRVMHRTQIKGSSTPRCAPL